MRVYFRYISWQPTIQIRSRGTQERGCRWHYTTPLQIY